MSNQFNRHLLLVNRQRPLERNYRPQDLVITTDCQFPVMLEKTVAIALQQLFAQIGSKGKIIQVSGYRDFETQEQLVAESLAKYGREFTESYVAVPGASEHQTGLAIDVALNLPKIDYLTPSFPDKGIALKFKQMASKFGFILRYPENKRAITGIAHEPWHFRYVGYPHSQIMVEQEWTLEDYIAVLATHRSLRNAYCWGPYESVTIAEKSLLAFYEELGDSHTIMALSPNNCGEVVVTCLLKTRSVSHGQR